MWKAKRGSGDPALTGRGLQQPPGRRIARTGQGICFGVVHGKIVSCSLFVLRTWVHVSIDWEREEEGEALASNPHQALKIPVRTLWTDIRIYMLAWPHMAPCPMGCCEVPASLFARRDNICVEICVQFPPRSNNGDIVTRRLSSVVVRIGTIMPSCSIRTVLAVDRRRSEGGGRTASGHPPFV